MPKTVGTLALPNRSLAGKIVVVVGGSGLIGKAFVRGIAEEGGTAVIASRHEARAQKIIQELTDDGLEGSALWISTDSTCPDKVEHLFQSTQKQFGRLDAVVNNVLTESGISGQSFEDVNYDSFRSAVADHVGSYFLLCQTAIRYFSEQGYGNIVNIASIYGVVPPKFEIYEHTSMTKEIDYVVSKNSIIAMTRYLAIYSKAKNIRVNCLSPGGVLDDQPSEFISRYNQKCLSKGMLSAIDLVGALNFLISDGSLYLNGQNIIVDDGFHLS